MLAVNHFNFSTKVGVPTFWGLTCFYSNSILFTRNRAALKLQQWFQSLFTDCSSFKNTFRLSVRVDLNNPCYNKAEGAYPCAYLSCKQDANEVNHLDRSKRINAESGHLFNNRSATKILLTIFQYVQFLWLRIVDRNSSKYCLKYSSGLEIIEEVRHRMSPEVKFGNPITFNKFYKLSAVQVKQKEKKDRRGVPLALFKEGFYFSCNF